MMKEIYLNWICEIFHMMTNENCYQTIHVTDMFFVICYMWWSNTSLWVELWVTGDVWKHTEADRANLDWKLSTVLWLSMIVLSECPWLLVVQRCFRNFLFYCIHVQIVIVYFPCCYYSILFYENCTILLIWAQADRNINFHHTVGSQVGPV